MDWNRYVHLQCERTELGLFNEPFNLATGALFFVVAFYLWKELKKQPSRPFALKFLIIMTGLIGAGSMTYHSVSRMWAAVFADVLPIAITAVVFLYLMMKHILRVHFLGGLLITSIFIFMNLVFKHYVMRAPDGYVSLFPTLFFLMIISVYMSITKNPSAKNFAIASVVAIIGIFFRVIDPRVCAQFPIGTHFLWHALMAAFFFLIVRETIRRYKYK